MNGEHLFESIGFLDDELIERSEQSVATGRKLWLRWCTAAACMALIVGAAVYSGLNTPPLRPEGIGGLVAVPLSPSPEPEKEGITTSQTERQEETEADSQTGVLLADVENAEKERLLSTTPPALVNFYQEAEKEPFVAIDNMTFTKEGAISGSVLQEALASAFCVMELKGNTSYTVVYALADINAGIFDKTLKESMGGSLEGVLDPQGGWGERETSAYEVYRVSGHKDLQYVIMYDSKTDDYSLFEFEYIQSSNYSYQEVLQLIYGIYSADDIIQITSRPSEMDNTDAGKAQKEAIGEMIITDRDEIQTVYDILCSTTCYGPDNWDKILHLQDDTPGAMLEGARLERYLTIETSWGNKIDTLKYTAMGKMFFEFGGVAYSPLNEEDAVSMAGILEIE